MMGEDVAILVDLGFPPLQHHLQGIALISITLGFQDLLFLKEKIQGSYDRQRR